MPFAVLAQVSQFFISQLRGAEPEVGGRPIAEKEHPVSWRHCRSKHSPFYTNVAAITIVKMAFCSAMSNVLLSRLYRVNCESLAAPALCRGGFWAGMAGWINEECSSELILPQIRVAGLRACVACVHSPVCCICDPLQCLLEPLVPPPYAGVCLQSPHVFLLCVFDPNPQ